MSTHCRIRGEIFFIMREEIKTDCLFFNGYKPCKFHKQSLVHCSQCDNYRRFNKKILIIKLQAAGEVIRNTPLLHKIHQTFPHSKIYWLTKYPELLPDDPVTSADETLPSTFKILPFSLESVVFLLHEEFDIICSLDKDIEAASLANTIKAKVKKGFSIADGAIIPFDQDAEHKWLTGILDDKMKANSRHYVEEMFEICGFQWAGEEYILPQPVLPEPALTRHTLPQLVLMEHTLPEPFLPKPDLAAHTPPQTPPPTPALPEPAAACVPIPQAAQDGRFTIGLNTGAGAVWPTRVWSYERWVELINLLKKDFTVLLLGGPDEDAKNKSLAQKTGVLYYGVFPYRKFMGLVSLCDLIVTSVTMALHIAIGLKRKIVLLNNIFPSCEFYLYNLGTTLEPPIDCLGCYKTAFDHKCVSRNCLDLITAPQVETAIRGLL